MMLRGKPTTTLIRIVSRKTALIRPVQSHGVITLIFMGDFSALTSVAVDSSGIITVNNQLFVHRIQQNNNSQERASALHVLQEDYQS
mmetsp:Transcript_5663/g.35208  ORF Transcript_5663/g.35208 Transcript_5663/m.35208 type:complete len:87 (+) Transcript_5663:1372-1632(+)